MSTVWYVTNMVSKSKTAIRVVHIWSYRSKPDTWNRVMGGWFNSPHAADIQIRIYISSLG